MDDSQFSVLGLILILVIITILILIAYFGVKIQTITRKKFDILTYNPKSILLVLGGFLVYFFGVILYAEINPDENKISFHQYENILLSISTALWLWNLIYLIRKTNIIWALIMFFYQILFVTIFIPAFISSIFMYRKRKI